MPSPAELVHDRLRALLRFLKPKLAADSLDLDRMANLRRLSDVRIRRFAVERPGFTAFDLCGLLSDPRVGNFGELADEVGVLKKSHLAIALPFLGEDMGYLIEACLTLQVAGLAKMKQYAREFARQEGAAPAPRGTPSPPGAAAPARAAVVAQPPGPIKDLWVLPPSLQMALDLLGAADTPADRACAALERDPALAQLLLRLGNLATGANAVSLKRLVVGIGYPLARELVRAASLISRLTPPFAERGFDDRVHWQGALQCARSAAQISRRTKLGNPDQHFAAGLLHSVGRLAAAKAGGPSSAVSSAETGASLLERWNFPPPVVLSARYHAASPDDLEELQIPREVLVVAALGGLVRKPPSGEGPPWAQLLRVPPDLTGILLEEGSSWAQAAVRELLP